MNQLQAVKAEIERLYKAEIPEHDPQCDFSDGYICGLSAIDYFIESLEQEKSEIPTIRGYVARLGNGNLGLSASKPYYCTIDGKKIIGIDGGGFLIDSSLFPDIKWEDEPIEVELIIRKV